MAAKFNQPRADDAVLGGCSIPSPPYAAVLGGLVGVKRRFVSPVVSQRIAAVKDTIKYGQEGFPLLLDGLKDSDWRVRHAAYSLLKGFDDNRLRQRLAEYNPFQFLSCLYRHPTAQSTAYALWQSG
ncbi:HEAT repeat domain-containing protein [Coleofasciculus sp. LEGE 07092]|uniref:HEAT repeat domain-containing protein n=1 Tax=Coleofasciculus sp. LEGE 07092 TaxID=2777969 RepID=UPI00187E0276|nr:HEAT repeat domain-containing protein [Coleofasciculus sp. LEGE 07092]MBE9147914.1 hypothetical protein [Coleofasciculus sp. LEGE 07092]